MKFTTLAASAVILFAGMAAAIPERNVEVFQRDFDESLTRRACVATKCKCTGIPNGLFCGDGVLGCVKGHVYQCGGDGKLSCDFGVRTSCQKCNKLTC